MVELAILTPLFVTLTLGAIQTGLAIDATQRIINAARGAGRLAAIDYSDKLQSNQTGIQNCTSGWYETSRSRPYNLFRISAALASNNACHSGARMQSLSS